ncbi:hydrogenase maturation protease [Chromatium okenii]|uniref:hydrogenase maturation protease n=1 Tax=Chromatium okenii TaxID=61644 RepID=UPI001904CD76|nr:hydrogenase maturation protease [Chromatium okenii]
MKTLIIGYGSPIRGDDAIGPLVADHFARCELPPGVSALSRHILTAELVADLAAQERVIFVDAAIDAAPGEVRCQRLTPNGDTLSSMAHFLNPQELLAWCAALYGRVPESFLISAGGASFDYANYQLSPLAQQAFTQMVAQVQQLFIADGDGLNETAF